MQDVRVRDAKTREPEVPDPGTLSGYVFSPSPLITQSKCFGIDDTAALDECAPICRLVYKMGMQLDWAVGCHFEGLLPVDEQGQPSVSRCSETTKSPASTILVIVSMMIR